MLQAFLPMVLAKLPENLQHLKHVGKYWHLLDKKISDISGTELKSLVQAIFPDAKDEYDSLIDYVKTEYAGRALHELVNTPEGTLLFNSFKHKLQTAHQENEKGAPRPIFCRCPDCGLAFETSVKE